MNSSEVLPLSNGNFLVFRTYSTGSTSDGTYEHFVVPTLYNPQGAVINVLEQLRVGDLPYGQVGDYYNSVIFSIAQPDGGAMIYLQENTDYITDSGGNVIVNPTFANYIVTMDAQGAVTDTQPAPIALSSVDPGAMLSLGDGSGLNVLGNYFYPIAADGSWNGSIYSIDPEEMTSGVIFSAGALPVAGGGFFTIGWTDPSARTATGNFLYGSFVDANLAQVGAPFALLDDNYFPEAPYLEYDDYAMLGLADGRMVIALNTYDSADALSRVSSITMMVLNADGTFNIEPTAVNLGGELAARQFEPELFALEDGGFALAYQAGNEFVGQIDLHVLRFDANGVFQDQTVILDDQFDGIDPDIVRVTITPSGDILHFNLFNEAEPATLLGQLDVGTVVEPPQSGVIVGTAGPDTLLGTDGDDSIDAGAGDDKLTAGDGNDQMDGGDGDDGMQGQGGNDTMNGGAGDDNMSGSAGNDVMNGGAGNDNMGGGLDDDVMNGGDDNDTLGGGDGNDTLDGGAGNDVLSGGAGNDSLLGDDGSDTMGASYNNDTVDGGEGDDSIGGGVGRDSLIGGAGNDSIGGGEGDDTVLGGTGDDFLAGGGRDDVIDGGTGADTLNGGAGNDVMTGDEGADVFVFNSFEDGAIDIITDFEDGIDRFRMTGVMGEPGSGLQGRVDALDITDLVVDGQASVTMSYEGNTILLIGVSSANLGVDDFTFL